MSLLTLNGTFGAVPFAELHVFRIPGKTPVRLFADANLTDVIANPLKADAEGNFRKCYVLDGTYFVEVRHRNGHMIHTETNTVIHAEQGEMPAGAIREFASFDALMAESTLSYGTASHQVVTGARVRLTSSLQDYLVASPNASDHHVTMPGGVKLYVCKRQDGSFVPHAFGAVGDGITDDTAAMQACLDAAINQGGMVALGSATYRILDQLNCVNADGLQIFGAGSGFDGPSQILCGTSMPDKALFRFEDCRNVRLRDFSVPCSAANNVKCAIEFTNGVGNATTPTHYFLDNLYLYSTSAGTGMTNGVLFSQGAGGDANNDFGQFHKVVISNYDNAAVKIEHSQSREHRFLGCYFQTGAYGIDTNGYSFFWFGGNMSEHTSADFHLRREQQSSLIQGLSSEQSARLLETGGASAADSYVTIQGVRYSADFLHADERVIRFQHRGALVLGGNVFGTRTDSNLCKVQVAPIGNKGCSFISQGNTWGGQGSLRASPYQIGLSRGDRIRIADTYVDDTTVIDTAATFVDQDATPSVFAHDFFETANTVATTITALDDAWPGKITHILFGDANTTVAFASSPALSGNGGADFTAAAGDSMICTCDGARHHCVIIHA